MSNLQLNVKISGASVSLNLAAEKSSRAIKSIGASAGQATDMADKIHQDDCFDKGVMARLHLSACRVLGSTRWHAWIASTSSKFGSLGLSQVAAKMLP